MGNLSIVWKGLEKIRKDTDGLGPTQKMFLLYTGWKA